MNLFKILRSLMFCTAVLALFGAPTNAAVIPVVNPDFSMFPAGQSAATYLNIQCVGTNCVFADNNTVGWMQTATRSNCCDAGQYQIGATGPTNTFNSDPMFNGKPEPIVFREINANASQDISTPIVAGVTYTLDVDLGFPNRNPTTGSVTPDAASVFLTVDGHQVKASPLNGSTQVSMYGSGNWYDFQASYTATSSDPNGLIDILLFSNNNGNGFGFFGDVRLTDSTSATPAVPEPATWAMMLIGFGGIAGVVAARRRRPEAGQLA